MVVVGIWGERGPRGGCGVLWEGTAACSVRLLPAGWLVVRSFIVHLPSCTDHFIRIYVTQQYWIKKQEVRTAAITGFSYSARGRGRGRARRVVIGYGYNTFLYEVSVPDLPYSYLSFRTPYSNPFFRILSSRAIRRLRLALA